MPVSGVDDVGGKNRRTRTKRNTKKRHDQRWNVFALRLALESRMKCSDKNVRMRAYSEVFCVHTPSRSRVSLLAEHEIKKKKNI